MDFPESYRALLGPAFRVLEQSGLTRAAMDALRAGIVVGASWATHRLEPVTANDLAMDMLASYRASAGLPLMPPAVN